MASMIVKMHAGKASCSNLTEFATNGPMKRDSTLFFSHLAESFYIFTAHVKNGSQHGQRPFRCKVVLSEEVK